MPKRKTNEEFIKELKEKLPKVIPLEKYSNNHTKIKCKCLIHNKIYMNTPKRLLNGSCGCDECVKEVKRKNKLKTTKAKNYIKNLGKCIMKLFMLMGGNMHQILCLVLV